jgi:large-conductance mechanosensitive channel
MKMNIPVPSYNNQLLLWIAVTLLLASFALADTAIVVWSAALVSLGQLVASALAFLLIGTGVLFTVWQMRR